MHEFLTFDSLKPGGIVTLCGSSKLYDDFVECDYQLSNKGWIVLSHAIHKDRGDVSKAAKQLHYKKIMMSDLIVVITDPTGYIDESTKKDIELAQKSQISVAFYNHIAGIHNLTVYECSNDPFNYEH